MNNSHSLTVKMIYPLLGSHFPKEKVGSSQGKKRGDKSFVLPLITTPYPNPFCNISELVL